MSAKGPSLRFFPIRAISPTITFWPVLASKVTCFTFFFFVRSERYFEGFFLASATKDFNKISRPVTGFVTYNFAILRRFPNPKDRRPYVRRLPKLLRNLRLRKAI
nr:hypothetical protein [Crucivirus sp.]